MILETIVARRYLGLMTRPALFAPHFQEEVVNFGGKNLGHQLWRTGGIVRPKNFVPLLDKT
jgi:ferric iron reductase protein FhuF